MAVRSAVVKSMWNDDEVCYLYDVFVVDIDIFCFFELIRVLKKRTFVDKYSCVEVWIR